MHKPKTCKRYTFYYLFNSPLKGRSIPLSALPKDTQHANLPDCSPHYPFNTEH